MPQQPIAKITLGTLTRGDVERYLRRSHQVVFDSPVQVAERRQRRGPHPHDEVLILHAIDGADHLTQHQSMRGIKVRPVTPPVHRESEMLDAGLARRRFAFRV